MQTALSLRAAASHKGHATSCWSTEVRGEADDSSRGHVHAAEAAAPHQRHLSFVHTWKKTLLVFSSNLAYHILCTTLMMPVFFFFQSVEILIIGRLRKRAINISSAATGWGGGGGGERWRPAPLKPLMEEDGASGPSSVSRHLFLVAGDDFHRLIEIRDRKTY